MSKFFHLHPQKGEFALHIATTGEHMDLVELLLRYGAAVNVTDMDARTPLMLAARCGNAPLVELFLEYGAKRDMTDSSSKYGTIMLTLCCYLTKNEYSFFI